MSLSVRKLSVRRTVVIYQRLVVAGGVFFLLLDLGPGAAACGMGIEINTGYSLNFCGLFFHSSDNVDFPYSSLTRGQIKAIL